MELVDRVGELMLGAAAGMSSTAELAVHPPTSDWQVARYELTPHRVDASGMEVWVDNDIFMVVVGQGSQFELDSPDEEASRQLEEVIAAVKGGQLTERVKLNEVGQVTVSEARLLCRSGELRTSSRHLLPPPLLPMDRAPIRGIRIDGRAALRRRAHPVAAAACAGMVPRRELCR
jgi:hypothetical protein